ncbi:MAG: hypothetical protein F2621_06075 [Actinobacteria bacterium]|nr:hypothetical protein [Actinomycetota bacterium]
MLGARNAHPELDVRWMRDAKDARHALDAQRKRGVHRARVWSPRGEGALF